MTGLEQITDRTLRAWLRAGPVNRGIGAGLTFMASAHSAEKGSATWILRYRFGGASKEKVLGRYPDLSLKDAREVRKAQGIRQDDAAGSMGVSENFLGKIESGRVTVQWGKLFGVLQDLGIHVLLDGPESEARKGAGR